MANQLNSLQVQEIMALLPHRYPFLLIDKVIDYTPGESLTAVKNVTINEPIFTGHFPGMPVVPGVAQLDWVMTLAPQRLDVPPRARFARIDAL